MNILFGLPDSVPRLAAEAFLNSIWQSAMLAFLVWLLLLAFKRANATTKYGVWFATLLAIVCLPFLNAPASRKATAPEDVALSRSHQLETPALSTIDSQNNPQSMVVASADVKHRAGTIDDSYTVAAPVQAAGININSVSEVSAEPRTQEESFSLQLRGESWPQLFLIIWMVGAALMVVRLIRSYLSLRRLRLSSRPLADNYQQRLKHWSNTCGIRRTVSLRGSNRITVPLMLGLRKTTILFPERLIDCLAENEFDQVLLHELAHVRRRDDWGNLAQKLIEAIFFFHPVVLCVGRQLSAERECACDEWVVSVTGANRSYASCLAKLFELTKTPSSALLATGVIPVKSHLSRRIETILKSKQHASARLSVAGFFLPLCLLLLMVIHLGRLSPLIAVSANENSVMDSAEHNTQAGAARLEQPQPDNAEIDRVPGDLPGEMGGRSGLLYLNDSGATTPLTRESSVVNEPLGLSAPGGRMSQTHVWLEMGESTANILSNTAQPIALVWPAGTRQTETSGDPRWASSNTSVIQEPAASTAKPSSDESPLPSDFFNAVAASGNSASQREILSMLLKRRGLTKGNLIQSLVAAKNIDSDGEKAEFLVSASGVCTGDAEVLNAFFNAVSTIDSAGERRRVLSALLTLKGRDRGVLFRTLKAAAAISSDGEKAELLVKAASLYAIDNTPLNAFLGAVSSINSSAEQRRALTALLRQSNLSDEAIIQTVRFARRISSDGEKAEFLTKVAAICPISGGVLSAYLATASSINSSAEQARALNAIAKRKEAGQATETQAVSLARNSGDRD